MEMFSNENFSIIFYGNDIAFFARPSVATLFE